MDYKEKYNKLVEAVKVLQKKKQSDECIQNWVNDNVPELKESEDEKIKEALIQLVKCNERSGYLVLNNVSTGSMISWLEKQGGCKSALDGVAEEKVDNANKIESKFHVGDWVVNNNSGGVCQVTEIRDDEYCLCPFDSEINGYFEIIDVDNDYHLWTIEDAKDGDLLVDTNEFICIYDDLSSEYLDYYIALTNDGTLITGKKPLKDKVKVRPATYDESKHFFKMLDEKGYRWDAEKKVVKWIEPKFKVGDWFAYEELDTAKIIDINDDRYKVEFIDGHRGIPYIDFIDRNSHLWTIQDAKEGDVLASKDGNNILIFRNLDTATSFSSYYNLRGQGELGWSNECFIPATKEQRELLFEKMKEAGYEWDAEKKRCLSEEKFIENFKKAMNYC